MTIDMVIAGVGGQGVISLGTLLGEAAVEQGLDVWSSEVHGMAQRGGSVTFHLRIGKEGEQVLNPLVSEQTADILVGLDIMETLRTAIYVKKNGYIVHSLTYIPPPTAIRKNYKLSHVEEEDIVNELKKYTPNVISIDSSSIIQKLGVRIPENMVLLGTISALNILPLDTELLREYIGRKWPKFKHSNLKAFEAGAHQVFNSIVV